MTERADSTGRKSPREAGNSRVGEGSSPSRRVNGDTLLRQGSSQIPSKGRWIKRTEIVKYFKRTTTSEQYYDNGLLEFSHPPEVKDMETEPTSQSVSVFECTDEAFLAGRLRWKAGANVEEMTGEHVGDDEDKIQPTVQEPSEAGDSVTSLDEMKSKRRRWSKVRSVVSDDEDEVKSLKSGRSKAARPVVKDGAFAKGAYVLAKYNDNMYYPAQILSKDDQSKHWTVRFLDSKEEESVHEASLLKPSVWLMEDRNVMIKSGEGKGGVYLEAKILTVVKEESKAPRFRVSVQESGETKTVSICDVAITDDEVLSRKFDSSSEPPKDEDGSSSSVRRARATFTEGDLIFGLWTDQRFYPGKIASLTKDDKFSIDFLDQQHTILPAEDLISAEDIVRPGHSIQVQMPNSNFEKATVKAISGSGEHMQATVEYLDGRKDKCHISEMCFLNKDVRKILSGTETSSGAKMKREKESPQRASTRIKSEVVKEELSTKSKSPPRFKESKSKKPKSDSANRTKEVVLDSEDDDDDGRHSQSSDKTLFRIGQTVFRRKEEVFGLWEDKRWYAAWINGVRQSKFRVEWCENEQINFLGTDEIIRATDILQKGTRVNVIVENRDFYDEVTLESFMEDGNHLVKNKKNTIYAKKFEEMMIQADEVKKWRKRKDTEKWGDNVEGESSSKSKKRASPGAEKSSNKRPRSPSLDKEKPSKGARRSTGTAKPRSSKSYTSHAPSPAPEESPERDPGPPLANCSFIITSGQEKEKTFDRDYIAKKVVELGGAVLNTFEELTQSAGKRYLIAPGPCRTAKFLQCLAANIPCVSHQWILAVAEAQKIMDCDKFRLKTGKSSTLSEMMDWAPRKTLLDNLRVGLYGGVSFRTTWVPALKAGKAEPTVLEPHDTKSNMKRFDCVIVEDHAPAALVEHCHLDACPLVTVEWIIQTLIHGTKQSFEQWPYAPPDASGNSVSGVEDSMMRSSSRH